MMFHPKPLPLSFYVDHLNRGEPFSLVRFGDGEMDCILGRDGETCDHQPYTAELGAELLAMLLKPRELVYCIGPRAAGKLDVVAFMRRRGLHVDWHDSETLLDASCSGDLLPFVQALRQHKVLTVGPAHLMNNPAYSAVDLVEVPLVNAFKVKHRLESETLRQAYQADVILFSAGPCAKVMVYDLFPHLGATHTMLDVGSLFDWYSGVDSRSYSRKWDTETRTRLKTVNLGSV